MADMGRKEMLELALGLMLAEEKRLAKKRSLTVDSAVASEAEKHKATTQYEKITAAIKTCERELRQGVLF